MVPVWLWSEETWLRSRSHALTCMGRSALAHTDEVALVPCRAGDGAGTGHPQVLFFPPHPEPLGDSLCGIVVFSSCSNLPPENLVGADLHFPLELVEPQEGIGGSCSDLQPEAGSGNVESRRDILSTEPDSSFCIQLTKTGVRPNSAYLLAKAAPDPEA